MKKIVVIGGGTGTYTVLSGLKRKNVDLTSIVTVVDSGGSTGILRDEFGFLPMGDFRMALVAMADSNGNGNILRDLFLYRFEKGAGLSGHNFGNLFLTVLTDMLGDANKAFEYASKILRVKGKVLPVANENITLIAKYENGEMIFGESHIDEPHKSHDGTKRIVDLKIQPQTQITPQAEKAIEEADMIVVGPGDLYTSILANLIVPGVAQAILRSKAKLVFITNLINKFGQTHEYSTSQYVKEIKKYLGKYPDFVLVNKERLPEDILKKYEKERGFPVQDDLVENKHYKVIHANLLSEKNIKRHSGDVVKRSLIRHDSDKLAKNIMKILRQVN